MPPKKKRVAKTKKLTRKATFVRGRHLVIDKAGAPTRTLNVVQRAALNPVDPNDPDAPKVRGVPTTGGSKLRTKVFFKPHDDQDAASQYAVASTRLARFLGMPELIAHNAFAKVHNVRGVVSGAVPGSPLYSAEKKMEVQPPQGYSKQDIQTWVKSRQLVEQDGKYYDKSKDIYQWVDFKDERIQKGLSDLQLFDAISGQIDRHAGNIYVDPKTGQVSGIDDDKSFGQGRQAANQTYVSQGGYDYYRGLPALVDKETAERILALDPTDLPAELFARVDDSRVLTKEEIEEAVRRFVGVQLYLRDLQKRGALVGQNDTSWGDATYQQALQAPTSSYLGYQATALENALQRSANNDPMYEVVDAPQPPTVMPPLPRLPWQRPTLPLQVPPITLPPPSTSLGPESPRTEVSPSRATAARLAARRSPRPVPPTTTAVEVDDSGDSSEDSTTSSADDS